MRDCAVRAIRLWERNAAQVAEFQRNDRFIVAAGADVLSSDLAGEVMILDLRTGIYYGLNAVAARVWDMIKTPRSFQEVRDTVRNDYEVDWDRCEVDLLRLIHELVGAGLVEIRDAAAS
jgi:hypothetical protein